MSYEMTNFENDVIRRSHKIPVLVDFWAEWCGPCKILGPVLEKLAKEQKDRWALVKVDTEAFPELAMQFHIQSIPNVKLFVDGKMVNEFIGALPEAAIRQWLEKTLPNPNRKLLEQAQELLAAGKNENARKLLTEILKAEPENPQAKTLLAQSFLYSDPEKALALVSNIQEDSEYFELAETIRVLGRLFEIGAEPEKLPDSPVKNHYLSAIKHLQAENFDQALANFIDIIQKDRYYDNDGSRKAGIAIFKFLGEGHELTRKHRPAFSRALYI